MPLCFDLDGTLGTFGSGYRLLRQALGELWREEPGLEELRACAGSTDWEIVDELHRRRFQRPLADRDFHVYARACLAQFERAYGPGGEAPVVFEGMVGGLAALAHRGHAVCLVSGNVPEVLAFKARRLGVPAAVTLVGSRPRTDRTALLRHGLTLGPHPHAYIGDRPHDQAAAAACGVPFLGIGPHLPEGVPSLEVDSQADHLVETLEAMLRTAP